MPEDLDPQKVEEIENSDEIWVIDFWAEWCHPCKELAPIFEKVSEEVESVNFGKVDIEDHQSLAQKFGVRAIPTMIVMKGDEQVDRKSGALDEQSLKSWVESNSA